MSVKTRIVRYDEIADDHLFIAYMAKAKKKQLLEYLKEDSNIADLKGCRVLFNRFTFWGHPVIVYFPIGDYNKEFVEKFLSDLYLKSYRHFIQITLKEWQETNESKMIYTATRNQKYYKYDFD